MRAHVIHYRPDANGNTPKTVVVVIDDWTTSSGQYQFRLRVPVTTGSSRVASRVVFTAAVSEVERIEPLGPDVPSQSMSVATAVRNPRVPVDESSSGRSRSRSPRRGRVRGDSRDDGRGGGDPLRLAGR